MPNSYNIKGTLTFEEYLECHKILAAKRRFWIRGIITIYGIGMLIYGLFIAPSKPDSIFAAIGVIMLAYGIMISPIQFRYRVKRNWDRYPRIKKEFDMAVSAEGVETQDDKGRPSHSAWGSFLRFRESESLFLLYLSPLLPLCLPKRLVPEEDLSGLRALLSSAIGHQTNGEQGGGGQPATRPESK
jgi:YcxB-like protein